jgi:phage terminase small subunit
MTAARPKPAPTQGKPPRPLAARQARFVAEFLLDLNAAAAYRRAGYRAKTDKVAAANAARLIASDSIQAAITAALAERSRRVQITQDDVIRGLHAEANYRGEGASHQARVQAWFHVGRHLGMFPVQHTHAGDRSGPIKHQHQHTTQETISDDERVRRLAYLAERVRQRRAVAADAGGEGGVRRPDEARPVQGERVAFAGLGCAAHGEGVGAAKPAGGPPTDGRAVTPE